MIDDIFWFSQLPSYEIRWCLKFYADNKDKPNAGEVFAKYTQSQRHGLLMRQLMRGFLDVPKEKVKVKISIEDYRTPQITSLFKARLANPEKSPEECIPYQKQTESEILKRESEAWDEYKSQEDSPQDYQAYAKKRAYTCNETWRQEEPSFAPKKGLRKKDKDNGGNVFDFQTETAI